VILVTKCGRRPRKVRILRSGSGKSGLWAEICLEIFILFNYVLAGSCIAGSSAG